MRDDMVVYNLQCSIDDQYCVGFTRMITGRVRHIAVEMECFKKNYFWYSKSFFNCHLTSFPWVGSADSCKKVMCEWFEKK